MWAMIYAVVLWLLLPVVLLRLWWRGFREPGYRENIAGRFGSYKGCEPAAVRTIWIHAVSVGETRAAQTLVRELLLHYPGHRILLTHMTASGRAAARQLFGNLDRVTLAWLPYDYHFAVRKFLAHFKPQLGIIMETEIWITLLDECARAGIPTLLANARLSSRSEKRYALVLPLVRKALASFSGIGAQSKDDELRFLKLGAINVQVTGNLKYDAAVVHDHGPLSPRFREWFGERKVVLAASLREGEEKLVIDAVRSGGGLVDNALLVIVPRHPQRFDEVSGLMIREGIRHVRRSASQGVPAECRFVLGDSMGEMQAYYEACDCAFVGGSLLEYGGQNLIEACSAGVPVLFGMHTFNFSESAEAAVAAGAAIRVSSALVLVQEINKLLRDEPRRGKMGQAARAFCQAHRGATERTLRICRTLLPSGYKD